MIFVETIAEKTAAEQRVEIVERKGKGHPDSMCDAIMDAISVALSAVYLREFGMVLHHNIDKGLLAAGKVERWFGGGRVIRPMELVIGDRATFEAEGRIIPVVDIALDAAKKWLKSNIRRIDPERDLSYRVALAPGSEELTGIFKLAGDIMVANDTSAAVGYYPFTPTEQAVLGLEKMLNSESFKERFPETGEDVKVMGVRTEDRLDLTVAMPLLSTEVMSVNEYFARKEVVVEEMRKFIADNTPFPDFHVHYNALDRAGRGLEGVYLTLLGTSAEDADSGQVGRGNRVNGLISVNRPLGTEAAAGKNPTSHVGKIYNFLANRLAKNIYGDVAGLKEVRVLLSSRIGLPVNAPPVVAVQLFAEKGFHDGVPEEAIRDICLRELQEIGGLCRELARGEHSVC
ncbi:methionine adenosyltransferase [Geobacter sp. DSM 9736]|uniref:methionine adenosyltransferase n=1 Tax=Geobacter sp. DSM 9736 TaxID=1277350 RepID=UPI000B507B8E|nr:methionine adenosyltransferase [Geobacter sp. DSM 9736]SNB47314.1 methionine adenosyltransferase [Geobacter sp. DSM 9736]